MLTFIEDNLVTKDDHFKVSSPGLQSRENVLTRLAASLDIKSANADFANKRRFG